MGRGTRLSLSSSPSSFPFAGFAPVSPVAIVDAKWRMRGLVPSRLNLVRGMTNLESQEVPSPPRDADPTRKHYPALNLRPELTNRASALLLLVLLGIILLAAFLRLYRLDVTPPGFHYDEAFNAIQARDVLSGANRPIFFTGNFGEEPMQMYVEAAVFAVAGQSPWSARLSNVILGLLLVPSLYFCARALFPSSPFAALSAAFVGATLYWAINFSRLGIETNSLPWVLTLSAGALAAANSKRDWKWGIASGLLLGLTLYTYLAGRIWPFAIVLWFAYLLLLHRADFGARFRVWILVAVFALLAAAPLILFFLANPLALTGRSGQVLSADQFGMNLLRTAGMYFVAGDTDPRDNLPGRTVLDPFLAALFLMGVIISLLRARRPNYAFLLIWLVVMSLPSALTEFAPNFRRAIGALPAIAMLCAVGADWLWGFIRRAHAAWGGSTLARSVLSALVIVGFASSAYSSGRDYFASWAAGTGLYYSFDAGILNLAKTLSLRPPGEQLYLSPDYHDHPTVLWALDGRSFSSFDSRRVVVLPNSALPATYAIITHEDQTFSFRSLFPSAERLATFADFQGRPYAETYRIPAGAVPVVSPKNLVDAHVGQALRILGYDLTRRGALVDVLIYWRADEEVQEDYTVFSHLLDSTGSRVLAQDDAEPGHGTYPTSRWRQGETVVDKYELATPLDGTGQPYHVELGMYLLSTGARLPVMIGGQRAQDDKLLIREIPQ